MQELRICVLWAEDSVIMKPVLVVYWVVGSYHMTWYKRCRVRDLRGIQERSDNHQSLIRPQSEGLVEGSSYVHCISPVNKLNILVL